MWCYAIIVFVNQFVFISCKTWNIKSIADEKILNAIISEVLIYISWMISVFIGVNTIDTIVKNKDWSYIVVIVFSIVGSSLGTYIGMYEKNIIKQNNK